MKNIILLFAFLSLSWSQCDANDDGDLDVMDIIVQVNCILDECWDEHVVADINGFWMLDSADIYVSVNDSTWIDDMEYCGEYDEYQGEYGNAFGRR